MYWESQRDPPSPLAVLASITLEKLGASSGGANTYNVTKLEHERVAHFHFTPCNVFGAWYYFDYLENFVSRSFLGRRALFSPHPTYSNHKKATFENASSKGSRVRVPQPRDWREVLSSSMPPTRKTQVYIATQHARDSKHHRLHPRTLGEPFATKVHRNKVSSPFIHLVSRTGQPAQYIVRYCRKSTPNRYGWPRPNPLTTTTQSVSYSTAPFLTPVCHRSNTKNNPGPNVNPPANVGPRETNDFRVL